MAGFGFRGSSCSSHSAMVGVDDGFLCSKDEILASLDADLSIPPLLELSKVNDINNSIPLGAGLNPIRVDGNGFDDSPVCSDGSVLVTHNHEVKAAMEAINELRRELTALSCAVGHSGGRGGFTSDRDGFSSGRSVGAVQQVRPGCIGAGESESHMGTRESDAQLLSGSGSGQGPDVGTSQTFLSTMLENPMLIDAQLPRQIVQPIPSPSGPLPCGPAATPCCLTPIGAVDLHSGPIKEPAATLAGPKKSWANILRPNPKSSLKLQHFPPVRQGSSVKIHVPKQAAQDCLADWENSIVGYFLNGKMPFTLVKSSALKLWGSSGLISVSTNGAGFFFFKFIDATSRDQIIEGGPWHIGGKPVILKKWHARLKLSKESFQKIPVWIKFFNVPNEYWNAEGFSYVGSAVGKPLYVDKFTEIGDRRAFIRMCVEIDAAHPLVDSFEFIMEGEHPLDIEVAIIGVEYQWKPTRCEQCSVFGHDCARSQPNKVSPNAPQTPKAGSKASVWVPVNNKGKGKLHDIAVVHASPSGPVLEPIPIAPLHHQSNLEAVDAKHLPPLDSGLVAAARIDQLPPAIFTPVHNNFSILDALGDTGELTVPVTQGSPLFSAGHKALSEDSSGLSDPTTASPDTNPIVSKIKAVDEFMMKNLEQSFPPAIGSGNTSSGSTKRRKKKKGPCPPGDTLPNPSL